MTAPGTAGPAPTSTAQVYRTVDVPVRGGKLRVGVWEPADAIEGADSSTADIPTVIAAHGVTASHRCWDLTAHRLPGFRVVAPDLRGRGRSNTLPGPFGIAQHADDMADVLDFLAIPTAVVTGHSMGGFVAVMFAHRHSGRTGGLLLVDGGLPLEMPEGMSTEDLIAALGPAADRLTMTFPSHEAYQQFWRLHPALVDGWNQAVTDYVDYDLAGTAPELRPATNLAAMTADVPQQYGPEVMQEAVDHLPSPTIFLRSPRGFFNDEPGLYPPARIRYWQEQLPALDVREVSGVNHYTILLGEHGADAVAGAVLETMQHASG